MVLLRKSLALQSGRGQRASPPQQERQETERTGTLSALPQQGPQSLRRHPAPLHRHSEEEWSPEVTTEAYAAAALKKRAPQPQSQQQQQQQPQPQQKQNLQPLRQVRQQQQAPGPLPRRRPRASAADACTVRPEAGGGHDAGIDPLDALIEQVLTRSSCPFQVLGLEPSASAAAVRKRYLRLALKLHPDKAAHVRAAEAFAALEHAYEHAYKRAQRERRQCTPGS